MQMTYTGQENYVVFWDGEIIGLRFRSAVNKYLRERGVDGISAYDRWGNEVFLSDY